MSNCSSENTQYRLKSRYQFLTNFADTYGCDVTYVMIEFFSEQESK